MEQVVTERPFFEDPHIKQQQTSTGGTLGVFGVEFQDLSHGWYPKRQTGLSSTPVPARFLGSNQSLHHKGEILACGEFHRGKFSHQKAYKFQHPNSHRSGDYLRSIKIVSTPGGSEKTEAVKTKSRNWKRKRSKCPVDTMKKETTDPATQSASKIPGEAEIGQGDVMKQVKQDGEKTEAVKTKSRKKKKRLSKHHADAMKKETIGLGTLSASKSPGGSLDSSTSILNQRSEAEIGQGDIMKQVKRDGEGLVTETREVSTSAGKNAINAEVIVSDSTGSCEKNHTSPVVSVLNKESDAEMKIVSTPGGSDKTEAMKTNSRKRERRHSKRPADPMKKETTDPATLSASKSPGGNLDSSISVNQRSEAETGQGDVTKQVKQDGEGLVMKTYEISTLAGKNDINAEVIGSDSTVSCEKNHASPVVSVLNEDGDAEMKIVSTPGESEKIEARKTNSRKRKRKFSKRSADTMKETTDPVTQNASKTSGGCLDSSISILDQKSEVEIEQGDVMKQVKQDGKGLVIETGEISTSAGKNAVSTVTFEKNHASPVVNASKSPAGELSLQHPHDFSGVSADLCTINHPVQQHEQKNEELISEIQNNNQPALNVLQDEPVRIDDSGCCSMQTLDSSSWAATSVSKRKLLVLDINGILVDVTWITPRGPKPDIMVSRKGVFKRPFCDDFLKFCFERFDVGVWSSRVRVNLDKIVDFVMGDSKKRLLFCWDQSHCTQTGYNTRENRQKPLVLKELSKLWEKKVKDLPWESGYYNKTNTVLVDDSPYKALRNPPNTAIFLHPYSCEMLGDQSLGPDGDLRKYLIRLSEAENVQKFIEENPFGQDPITESSQCWGFYRRIAGPSGKGI